MHGVIGTIFGVLTLLFSASGVLIELRDALNYTWEVPVPTVSGIGMITSFLKKRLFSFGMVLSIGFLLIISLAVSTWITALGAHSASITGSKQHYSTSRLRSSLFVVITIAIWRNLQDHA